MNTLLLDIETAPNLAYTWDVYETNVIKVLEPWYVLCMAWKWLDAPTTEVLSLPEFELSEATMLGIIWDLLDEADIVVAHNGDKFDIRKLNARMQFYGFGPPSPYKTVDTLKVARQQFKFNHNGLDPLSTHLELGKKAKHQGFELWERCMQDPVDEVAWRKMCRYAKQDVVLLEKLYKRLRPWMKTHPTPATPGKLCPTCQSPKLQRRGFARTKTMTYQQYHCKECGAWSRARLSEPVKKPEVV